MKRSACCRSASAARSSQASGAAHHGVRTAAEQKAGTATLPDDVIPGGTLSLELMGELRLTDALLASWHGEPAGVSR